MNSAVHRHLAFSLVELSLSLGIVAFAVLALFGLLSNGLIVSKNAREEMHAAQVASSILAERRAAPTVTLNGNPLPPLTNSGAGLQKVQLDRGGRETSTSPYFSLFYEVVATSPRSARVFLTLAHPAQTNAASFANLAKAQEKFEVSTVIRLPDES